MSEQVSRQELHCHACQRYVQFTIDLSLDGNHVLECPICGHEHCRVVKSGKITDIRWGQRNAGPTWAATFLTSSAHATITTRYVATASTTATLLLSASWAGTQGTY